MSFNRIPELVEELKQLSEQSLVIGIFGEEAEKTHDSGSDFTIGQIAGVHEFGATYTVDAPVSGHTTLVNIPERSFIRAGFDAKESEIKSDIELLLDGILQGGTTADGLFTSMGGQISDYIREYLTALSSPPLKPETVRQTGRSNPLIHTGRLKGSISWKVE